MEYKRDQTSINYDSSVLQHRYMLLRKEAQAAEIHIG